MKNSNLAIAASGLLVASSAPCRAAHVIDNLTGGTQAYSESLSGPDGLDDFGFPFENREIAFSFTTGSTAVYLTEISFVSSIAGFTNSSPIQLALSTGSNAPGGINPLVLGTVSHAGLSPITQTLTLVPGMAPVLQANTLHWVHFTVPSGSNIYTVLNANSPVVDPEWSLGTTWRSDPFTVWEEINPTLFPRVRLGVEVVPEPSALLSASFGFVLLLRRRK